MLTHELIGLQPTLRRIVGGDEDALQNANLHVLQHADSIRDPSRYATRAAKRCWQDARERQTKSGILPSPSFDAALVDPSPTPAEFACAAEELEMLRFAIDHLPARQREAIENPGRARNSNRYKALNSLRRELAAPHRER